jgi:hypothetical protein
MCDVKSEGDMSDQKKDQTVRGEQGDDDALSPDIRRLILSYRKSGSERTWKPDAFARQSGKPSRPRAA